MIGISTSPRRVTWFNDFTVGILLFVFFFIVLITACKLQSAEILLLLVTCEY